MGVIEDCLDAAVEYGKERSQHGKAIARHQLVQEHIAQIEVARQTSASIVADAARWKAASDDRPATPRSAPASTSSSRRPSSRQHRRLPTRPTGRCRVHGGRGWSDLYRPGRHLKDVRVCRIYEGTDEVLKLKIAPAPGRDYAAFR